MGQLTFAARARSVADHLSPVSFELNTFQEYFTQYQWDEPRGLEIRYLAGTNRAFRLINKEKSQLQWAIGVFYELERWNYSAVKDSSFLGLPATNFSLIKYNTYIRYLQLIGKNNKFLFVVYVQGRPDSFALTPRFAGLAEYTIVLNEKFSFTFSFSNQYDLKPVVPVRKHFFSIDQRLNFIF